MEEEVHGVYNIECIEGKNEIMIKQVDRVTLKKGDRVNDVLVDRFNIGEDVNGEIFLCNILTPHLLSNKELPVYYVNVIYGKPLRQVLLMRLVLKFLIKSNPGSKKELLGSALGGEYWLEFRIEDKKDREKVEFNTKEKLFKNFKSLLTTGEMKELMEVLKINVDKEWAKQYPTYEEEDCVPPKRTISLKDYESDSD